MRVINEKIEFLKKHFRKNGPSMEQRLKRYFIKTDPDGKHLKVFYNQKTERS